jgi:diguanylate cyclase (GGDEF)-like protein
MKSARLPRQIATMMIVAVSLCVAVLALGLSIICAAMDQREVDDSRDRVRLRLANQAEVLRTLSLDYNEWSDAHDAIVTGDWLWVFDNYAITAARGELMDAAILVGGGLPDPIAWVVGQTDHNPVASPLGDDVLSPLVAQLVRAEADGMVVSDSMLIVNGQAILAVVTRVRPTLAAEGVSSAPIAEQPPAPVSVFTQTFTPAILDAMATQAGVADLRLSDDLPRTGPKLVLGRSETGGAVGLVWEPDRPGSDMIRSIWPLLALVLAVFMALAIGVGVMARVSARALIGQEALARHQARTDSLTGLPNRFAFGEQMRDLDLAAASRVAVTYVDINDFKQINDSIGHLAGDAVIVAFAARLRQLISPGDILARVGGDEFVILRCDVEPGDAAAFRLGCLTEARNVALRAAEPLTAAGQTFQLSASVGLAISDGDVTTADELTRRADLAMYEAKKRHSAQPVVFTPDLDLANHEQQRIAQALREAMTNQTELTVVYQPIVQAGTGRLVRAEALARWTSPLLGPVPPDRFIAVAEQTGLILQLGRHLLDRIADDLATEPDLSVAINISPLQLTAPGFVQDIQAIMARAGVDPSRVGLELTEGQLVTNPDSAAFCMDALHERGFSVALDDFGTGFSSIGYLRRMPFDEIKIDRSFLRPPGSGAPAPRNAKLIQTMIHLGHAIGKTVVFEGVETEEEADMLTGLGCDRLQGYHFGRPMTLRQLITRFPDLGSSRGLQQQTG